MFILDVVVDVVKDLTRFQYRHNLAIDHLVSGVSDHVGLVMEPLFPIVQVYGYVPLNKLEEPKDHMDSFLWGYRLDSNGALSN